jgi:hypothetical protein
MRGEDLLPAFTTPLFGAIRLSKQVYRRVVTRWSIATTHVRVDIIGSPGTLQSRALLQ